MRKEPERNRADSGMPPGSPEPAATPGASPRRRPVRYAVWVAWAAGLLATGVLVLLGSLLLALQSEKVSTSLAHLVTRVASSGELQLQVEGVKGSWVRGLSATGVGISFAPEGEGGGWAVAVDTVSLSYRLSHLFRRTVWVDGVEVVGIRGRVRLEGEDPELPEDPPLRREDEAPWLPGGWKVRVGTVGIHAPKVEVWEERETGRETPDSHDADPWTARDVRIRLRDLELGATLAVVLEGLEGAFQPPGAPPEWGRVGAWGRVEEGRSVVVDSLFLESPESRLQVRGMFPLALEGLAPGGVDLSLTAEPLHMRDLGPLLPPTVSDSIRLYARGGARTSEGVLLVEVEADSRGAGRLEVKGELEGEAEDPAIRARAGLTGLDLQAWGMAPDLLILDALLEADVTGTPARARGWGSVEAFLHHGGQDLEVQARLLARSEAAGDPWRGEWSVASAGVELEGTGMVALGEPLVSALEGRLAYDRAAGAPPIPGVDLPFLRGRFSWDGRGVRLDSLVARGEVRIDTAAVNRAAVEGLVMTADTDLGQASLSMDGAVAGGRLTVRGEMDLLERTGRLLEARLEGVDVAALAGDSIASVVDATVSGSLQALSPLRASGTLRVHGAEYGEMRMDSALVTADVRERTTNLRLEAAFPDSAEVWLAGGFEASEGPARVRVDSLRFAHLDLRALLGGEEGGGVPSTDLWGAGFADLAATARGWEGRAFLELAPSRVGTQVVEEGRLTAELAEVEAEIDLDVRLPEGGIMAQARLEGLNTLPEVVVPLARFQAVDVGALLGRDELEVRLSGRMEGRLRGSSPGDMVGQGLLVLEESRLAGVSVDTATLGAQVDEGRVESTLEGRVSDGSIRGVVVLDRMGAGLEEVEAEVGLEADSVTWEGVFLEEGRLRLTATDGVLALDTLTLRSGDGVFLASGKLPLSTSVGRDGEIRLRGELTGGDLLAALSGAELVGLGSGVLEGTVTGALDELEMRVAATVDALLLDGLRVQGMDLRGEALYTEAEGLVRGGGTLQVDELDLPAFPLRRLDVEANLEPEENLAVTASAVIDDHRDASVLAQVELAPAPLAVLLERLDIRMDQDRWALAHPTRIDLSDGVAIDSLVLASGHQEILARGRVGTHGPLDLQVDVREFRMEAATEMVGLPAMRGPVSGVLAMAGTAEAPLLDAAFSSRLEDAGVGSADLALDASFAEGALVFQVGARLEDARGIRAGGTLPFDFSLASPAGGLLDGEPILVEAAADSLPLDWVSLFVPGDVVRDLRGELDGTVRIEGHPESPRFAGNLDLHDASLRLPALGVEYRRVGARVRFQEDQVLLDSLRIRSGRGSLAATGAVTLPRLDQPEFAASVSMDRFHAMGAAGVDATVSGELALSGSAARPALSGWIELERGEFQIGDMVTAPGVRTVTLSEEDYQELAEVFGYRPPPEPGPPPEFFDHVSLDVDVRIRRGSWVRQRANPELAVQFAGEVSVQKEPGGSLLLVGTVESVPRRSYVEQFGRRFSIAAGTLEFRGSPAATLVDLRAEYAVASRENPDAPQVVVALDITGTPDDLRLELSSTPTLEPSDMVAYIVTGRPAGRTLGGNEAGTFADAGEAFALGLLSGTVEAYAREQVGLDVIEITTDGLKGMTLVAGRYVSPSLYLGIRQPLSLQRQSGESSERPPDPELEVELEALRWLLLNLQAGGRSGVELFLRSRIAYD